MTVDTKTPASRSRLELEVAVLQLARAMSELGQATQRLAHKQHLDLPKGKDVEAYEQILQSLAKARKELERMMDTLTMADDG